MDGFIAGHCKKVPVLFPYLQIPEKAGAFYSFHSLDTASLVS